MPHLWLHPHSLLVSQSEDGWSCCPWSGPAQVLLDQAVPTLPGRNSFPSFVGVAPHPQLWGRAEPAAVSTPRSGIRGCTALARKFHGGTQLFPAPARPGEIDVGLMPLEGG